MNRLRLAVFDVDGTLIDSEYNIVSAMTEAWARMQLGVPDPAAVRRIIGLSLVEACAALLPSASHETHRAVAEQYKDAFRALLQVPDAMAPLFPGVREVFDALEAEGWLLGLATGKSRRGVDRLLDHYGLEGRFVTIQTADDNPGKPHPGMLLRAAAETGVAATAVAMMGDTSYDMQMAHDAGAVGIGVSWGYHSVRDLEQAGARAVIDDFLHLAELLDRVMGEPPCA